MSLDYNVVMTFRFNNNNNNNNVVIVNGINCRPPIARDLSLIVSHCTLEDHAVPQNTGQGLDNDITALTEGILR